MCNKTISSNLSSRPGHIYYVVLYGQRKIDRTDLEYRHLKMDWTVGANNKIYTDVDISKSRMSSSWSREMELRFVNEMGNTFLTFRIKKAKSFDYDPDPIPPQSSRIISCDPAWGSSSFAVVVTDFRDGKICVLRADEYLLNR
jgi:hypothetical protein